MTIGGTSVPEDDAAARIAAVLRGSSDLDGLLDGVAAIVPTATAMQDGTLYRDLTVRLREGKDEVAARWRAVTGDPTKSRRLRTRTLGLLPLVGIEPGRVIAADPAGTFEPLAMTLAWLTGATFAPPEADAALRLGIREPSRCLEGTVEYLQFGSAWIGEDERPALAARQAPCWFVEELPAAGIDLFARSIKPGSAQARYVALRPLCIVDPHGTPIEAGSGEIAIDRGVHGTPARTGRWGTRLPDGTIEPLPLVAGDVRIGQAAVDTVALARQLVVRAGGDADVLARPALAGPPELIAFHVRGTDHRAGAGAVAETPLTLREIPALPRTAAGRVDGEALAALPIVAPAELVPLGVEVEVAAQAEWRFRALRRVGRVAAAPLPPSRPAREGQPVGTADAPPSLLRGPAPFARETLPHDLPAMLDRLAAGTRDDDLRLVDEAGERTLSYADLGARARTAAATLQASGVTVGSRVLVHLDPVGDFLVWFWASLYAGACVTPVGVSADASEDALRLAALAARLNSAAIVTTADLSLPGRTMLRPGEPSSAAFTAVAIDPDAPALILATSGSTGEPKLVPQSHRALIAQGAGSGEAAALSADDVSLNWMPLDHVGGVVMFHLRDVQAGAHQIQVARTLVLADPRRWLDLIDRHGVTVSWAPNFAFGLVADALADLAPDARRWSLETMRYLVNGGEAVVPAAARRFLARTAPYGLSAMAMKPAWGMSETCSLVLVGTAGAGTFGGDGPVSVGCPIRGVEVRVVDADGRLAPQGREGRLEVRGVSVTPGYLGGDGEETTPDGWFDTGDRAWLAADGVRMTGRTRDVVIVNGRNIGCAELEQAVAGVAGVELAHTTAIAHRPHDAETEQPALFFVASPGADLQAVGRDLVRTLARTLMVSAVAVPVAATAIPRTRIGKPQRQILRDRLEGGEYGETIIGGDGAASGLPGWFFRRAWRPDALRPGPERRRTWTVAGVRGGDGATLAAALAPNDAADVPAVETVVVVASGDDTGLDVVVGRLARALPGPRDWLLVEEGRPATAQDAAARGAAMGVIRSLQRERPGSRARRIEVPAGVDPAALARIVREEAAAMGGSGSVRRRGDARERLVLTPEAFHGGGVVPVVTAGRYLVTGALGEIGRMVTRWLHDRWGCEVVGVGRSEPPPDLPHLPRFRYATADVADAAALCEAIGDDGIDGMFHLAGDFELADIDAMDEARHDRLVRAKMAGALACARVLDVRGRGRPLLVLFGSVSSYFGGVGASAYAAGCAAQEALAEYLERRDGAAVHYLGWSQWPGVGLTRRNPAADLAARHGFLGIDERQGIASLERALAGAPGSLYIGLDQDNPAILAETDQGVASSLLTVTTAAKTAPPDRQLRDRFGAWYDLRRIPAAATTGDWRTYADAEAALIAIWRSVLGTGAVDVDRNFFELGGNSLRLLQAKGRVEEEFDVVLALADLLRLSTVRQLAAHLAALKDTAGSGAPTTRAAAAAGRDRAAARLNRRGRGAGARP